MNVEKVARMLSKAGEAAQEGKINLNSVSMKELEEWSLSDDFSEVVNKSLILNSDSSVDLYLYQYKALYELAKGNDVLLIYPCGAGKSRVIENAPLVVKLGFELRSGTIIKKQPSFGYCM